MPEANIDLGTLVNNRYRVQDTLGQGGFGRTYLASDVERFEELCVLKEFLPTTKQYAASKARELFEREARILYQIDHPQIPKFLSLFEYSERLFIVQEYICGKTYLNLLNDRITQSGAGFSGDEITQWLLGLLPVLGYLHDNNTMHRDISPENIMLPEGQDKPVLIDFGLVKQTVTEIWAMTSNHAGVSTQESYVGKFGYAPPEQIRMGQCYPCSDLYSLAVTAIVLLTGRDPSRLMSPSFEWEWGEYATVDDCLAQVLTKMLAERPSDRYQSASEILCDLQPLGDPSFGTYTKLEIEINQTDKNQQLAEIEETDYFQQIHREAEQLRNNLFSGELIEPSLSGLVQTSSGLGSNGQRSQGNSLAEALQTDPFLQQCHQLLQQYVGMMSTCILEDALEEYPDASKAQLVDVLGQEIPDSRNAAAFKQQLQQQANSEPALPRAKQLEPAIVQAEPPQSSSSDLLKPSTGVWLNPADIQPTDMGSIDLRPSDTAFDDSFSGLTPEKGRDEGPLTAESTPDVTSDFPPDGIPGNQPAADSSTGNSPPHPSTAYAPNDSPVYPPTYPPASSPAHPPTYPPDNLPTIPDNTSTDSPPYRPDNIQAGAPVNIPRPVPGEPYGNRLFPDEVAYPPDSGPGYSGARMPPPLNSTFLQECRHILSRYIGMMASCILEDILEDFPNISASALIDRLSTEIPDPQKAQALRRELVSIMDLASPPPPPPQTSTYRQSSDSFSATSSARKSGASSNRTSRAFANDVGKTRIQSTPFTVPPSLDIIELCKHELCRSLGPMASYIVEDLLDDYPSISTEQLIEQLVTEIPDPRQATEFRQRLRQRIYS